MYKATILILMSVFMASTAVFPFRNLFAEDGYSLVAVKETDNTMSAGLFASSDQEVVRKYMPTGKAPSTISTFVLFVGNEAVLFDAGLGGPAWVRGIEQAGVQPEKVKLILLTHMHGDHIGGLLDGDGRRFPNAEIRVAEPEYRFWYERSETSKSPQHEKVKKAYGDRFSKLFRFGDEVFSKAAVHVKAIDAVGHTPGHTAFLIESPKKRMLIVGDIIHAAALQFPKPECSPSYDVDPVTAAKTRTRILDFAIDENLPIAGMHLPSPSIGTVEKDGQGGYVFTPAPE